MAAFSDTIITIIGIGIPIVLGIFYFIITRKDRNKYDEKTITQSDEEAEAEKQALARQVKKELADEAEKVEAIRKTIAQDVKASTQIETDQKIREQRTEFDHHLEMLEERSNSRFVAMDKVNDNLMSKIVETAAIQAIALGKINESIESLRKLFYEISGKVSRVERQVDDKVDK